MTANTKLGYAALAQRVIERYNIVLIGPTALGELLGLQRLFGMNERQSMGRAVQILRELSWKVDIVSRDGRTVYRRNGQVKTFSAGACWFASRNFSKVIELFEGVAQ